ncbi:MAG: FHA domain-containing protein [Planctomycetia bacterium]
MRSKLIPLDGGDPIPLLKATVLVGRRPNCDIRLDFPNVSGRHCELTFDQGSWLVVDLDSGNGVKVNDVKVTKKRLLPGDVLAIARKHVYRIEYKFTGDRARIESEEVEDILERSLIERAGLGRGERRPTPPSRPSNDDEVDTML